MIRPAYAFSPWQTGFHNAALELPQLFDRWICCACKRFSQKFSEALHFQRLDESLCLSKQGPLFTRAEQEEESNEIVVQVALGCIAYTCVVLVLSLQCFESLMWYTWTSAWRLPSLETIVPKYMKLVTSLSCTLWSAVTDGVDHNLADPHPIRTGVVHQRSIQHGQGLLQSTGGEFLARYSVWRDFVAHATERSPVKHLLLF